MCTVKCGKHWAFCLLLYMLETFHNQMWGFVFPKLSSISWRDLPAESLAAESGEALSPHPPPFAGAPRSIKPQPPRQPSAGKHPFQQGSAPAATLARQRSWRKPEAPGTDCLGRPGRGRAAHLGEPAGGTRCGPAPPSRGGGATGTGRARTRQRAGPGAGSPADLERSRRAGTTEIGFAE